jgi:hypothetical protein
MWLGRNGNSWVANVGVEIPLAQAEYSPVHVPAGYYYRIPERTIYKSYPVYHPSKQPAGYIEWLRQQQPEIAFDRAKLKTASDWTSAGEICCHTRGLVRFKAPKR